MFKVTQNGMNRLDIEMSGKLNPEEMKIALDELVSKSENIENGKMLYDVIDFLLFARINELENLTINCLK